MKTSPRIPDPAAEEQASLWAARLEGGTLEASDRLALDAWLAESSAHRALLSDYCQFSADLEQQLPRLVASGAVTMPAREEPARKRWSLGWLSLATGCLAAAAVAITVWHNQPTTAPTKYATTVGQRQSIPLEDGTLVELNAQSSLVVETTSDERRVRLVSGEAFFSVAKDKSRPFIVETPSGSVRVTGTVFDVRTDKSELDVTVVEGSVQVRPSEAAAGDAAQPPSALTANMRLTAHGKVQVLTLPEGEVDDVLAWRQGQIMFVDTPLREAIAKVARYHGKDVTVSEGVAALPLSGRHELDNLSRFLDGIAGIYNLRVTIDPGTGAYHVSLLNGK